jgi:hypothetical protein
MGVRELLIGAIVLGGVSGYVWSVAPDMFAEAKVAAPPTPSIALYDVPPTTAEAEADSAWSAGEPAPAASVDSSSAQSRHAIERSAHYSGCNEVRALGKAPLYAGQPGYRVEMDGDGDGIACEPVRG